MNTIDEMIEVLQAIKEGKVIECRVLEDGEDEWEEVEHWHPDFSAGEYRVKKEPMVIWAVVYSDKSYKEFTTEHAANEYLISAERFDTDARVVKFVEEI